jgi:hypothetical protein
MFKIEKHIPVPESRRGRPALYPFAEMTPGESFLVADAEERVASIRRAANSHTRRTGKKFVVRLADGGVRVWCDEKATA